jgi:TRAP-type C4-dicarboxylate transport system permease small subunit
MQQISNAIRKLLNFLIAFSLALMCIFVFGNVVLRYVFNSGITWSEELSRFLFVWMIFIGAIAGLRDNQHLGVDMLVKKLPPKLKKAAYVFSSVLILITLWFVFDGSWKLTEINIENEAPATGLSLAFVYGIGIVASAGMGIIVLINVFRVLLNKATVDELILLPESEEFLDHSVDQIIDQYVDHPVKDHPVNDDSVKPNKGAIT